VLTNELMTENHPLFVKRVFDIDDALPGND
jgi:hypothetical protein